MGNIGQILWGKAPGDECRFRNNSPTVRAYNKPDKPTVIREIVQSSITYHTDSSGLVPTFTSVVDTVIEVHHNDFRLTWDQYYASCKKRGFLFGLITILSGVGAEKIASNPIAKRALYISAVVSFVLIAINTWKAIQAYQEVKEWKTLHLHAERISEMRKKAHEKDFLYVHEHRLKLDSTNPDTCLLPCEVSTLFNQYLTQYCTKMLEQEPRSEAEQKGWLADFQKNNPLSNTLFLYGISPDQETRFDELCADYWRCNQLIDPDTNYVIMEALAQEATDKNLETIEAGRKAEINVMKKISDCFLSLLQSDTKLKDPGYFLDKASINKKFTGLENEAKAALGTTLSAIEKAKNLDLESQIYYIKNLLWQARNIIDSPDFCYSSGEFSFVQAAFDPIPLMPAMDIKDFLIEAKKPFTDNPEMLNYIDKLIGELP